MQQVVKQIKERRKLQLQRQDIKYELWRLDDTEFRKLRRKSLPIKDDSRFYMNFYLSERNNKNKLNLAELFVSLTDLLGDSGDWIDDWKGSFSFPVLLVLEKEQGNFFYLMDIYDNRGTLYFSIYRVLESDVEGYDHQMAREPFELEFSRQEINYFISYFYGYLEGHFHSRKSLISSEQFFKTIGSNHIIYGYQDGKYFEECYEAQEAYQAAIEHLESMGICSNTSQDVNSILQTITSEIV
ncbi:hypothetical protein IQ244_23795 [Nostoc sp. LEGE 06077]|uniref:hypothetical protein n=1 Tax=Nostoc sp. LEGE 06077 TaxID=915325 RepID=UPI00187DF679|nr:hypothetical protein [Nostoc sp. LEGE 06077]MBE9209464.1 hypothetical protein [Nostoc sp. LEGE 06077]